MSAGADGHGGVGAVDTPTIAGCRGGRHVWLASGICTGCGGHRCAAPATAPGTRCARPVPCPYHLDGQPRGPNERGRWVEVLEAMRLPEPLPADAPHPVLGCRCAEGRIVIDAVVVAWLPGVHSCPYIAGRRAGRGGATDP